MTRTEKLLRELIALPSVNPAFLPADHALAGEKRVADFLAATAARAGLDIEPQPVLPGRYNLLARLTPSGRTEQRVVLAPHLDTVNGAEELFSPRRQGGRLYGRGACDTKGSVAAMFEALCAVGRQGRRPQHTEIVFAGLIDEENEQAGSRALVASGFKAGLAVVGEATQLRAVTAHKGSLWLELVTVGKAAHGAEPHRGRNAVHAMARVVDLLETEYAAQLGQRSHPLLGRATVSVGTICGGSQPNIVPDSCSIRIDRRTLPGESARSVRGEITALLQEKGLKAEVRDEKAKPCPPLETDPALPLVARFLASAGQRTPAGVNYFCDAAVLAGGGIPSLVFGPGDIAQAHTADEWISLKSLSTAMRMLTRFLRELP